MEYVVLRASHPTWLTAQLPSDAVELLKFRSPSSRAAADGTGSITFVNRGVGIARVVATHLSREALAVETVRGRLLASARPGDRHLFSIPAALLDHLGVAVQVRGPRAGKGTDDEILWFLPAPEYYAFRRAESEGTAWIGPSIGGSAHLYLAKGVLPPPRAIGALDALDEEIERDEWAIAAQAFNAPGRGRKGLEAR